MARSPDVLVPLVLDPGFKEDTEFTPITGITLGTPSKAQRGKLKTEWGLPFAPTCIIKIASDDYESGARERLEPSGYYRSTKLPPLELDGEHVEAGTFVGGVVVARWLLTSLVLTKTFWFEYGPVLRTIGGKSIAESMPISESRRPVEGVHYYRTHALPHPDDGPFSNDEFVAIATSIESYFRPSGARMDRIAVALASLWSSLCTPYPEQAYVSLAVAAEALLSTQQFEITHQLAERAAWLLCTHEHKPIDIYRRVKRLYATRSDIVHGRGISDNDRKKVARAARKGHPPSPETYELYLHPLSTTVPTEELRNFTELCVELIRASLLDVHLRTVLQSHDDAALDAFYTDLVMGVMEPDEKTEKA